MVFPKAKVKANYYIGLMSGTSMDAIDVALVEFASDGINLLAYEEFPIDESLKYSIRELNSESPVGVTSKYDFILGEVFAEAVNNLLKKLSISPSEIAAIGNHGQTILHLPDEPQPRTLQIGDPNIIAERTGIACISDFRRMDMAAGGQGAPLAPAFHEYAFRQPNISRVVLNIGGIANISILPADTNIAVSGFDTGPGNGLLDDWNRRHQGTDMDRDSSWALSGKSSQELLEYFLSDPYFSLSAPKSTGRDYFNLDWVERNTEGRDISPVDVQATLLELSWQNICQAISRYAPECQELYICGGGAKNNAMVEAIARSLSQIEVNTTQKIGLDPDAIEAVAFAWLAKQRIDTFPGTAVSVTGAKREQILGGFYLPS